MKETISAVSNRVNGLDLDALQGVVQAIQLKPAEAQVEFRVKTSWCGQITQRILRRITHLGREKHPPQLSHGGRRTHGTARHEHGTQP